MSSKATMADEIAPAATVSNIHGSHEYRSISADNKCGGKYGSDSCQNTHIKRHKDCESISNTEHKSLEPKSICKQPYTWI